MAMHQRQIDTFGGNQSGKRGRRQRGVAAVEFAIILPLLLTLMAFPIFFSRVLVHYSVAQKAARDAAMYFATIPLIEMKDNSRALSAKDMAEEIVAAEIAELRPGIGERVTVDVLCDGGPCGSRRPEEISVELRMRMFDDYFYYLTWPIISSEGIEITSKFTMKYLGK